MDLNVCSRRIHDGYATIRTIPRSRPRALYKTDSQEFFKESSRFYTHSLVSNLPLANEQTHQVPNWSDMGENKLLDNYGTFKRNNNKHNKTSSNDNIKEKVAFNTFSSQKINECKENFDKKYSDFLLSDVDWKCTELPLEQFNLYKNNDENHYDTVADDLFEIVDTKDDVEKIKVKQLIYAVPSITMNQDNNNESKLIANEKYVPNGYLYRNTAKYIEDINKNIAEIDKSYEEHNNSILNTHSGYGVINRIPNPRNMIPMFPIINSNKNNNDKSININEIEMKNSNLRIRPNSNGKFPPQLLPRSSSITNTYEQLMSSDICSIKSTESLNAISENVPNYLQNKMELNIPLNVQRNIMHSHDLNFKTSLIKNPISIVSTKTTNTIPKSNMFDSKIQSINEIEYNKKSHINDETLTKCGFKFDQMNKNSTKLLNCNINNNNQNRLGKRRYDTLPCRKSKLNSRSIHKSSEDVIDDENNLSNIQRSYTSTIDIRNEMRHKDEDYFLSLYLMDATDIILQGQHVRNLNEYQVPSSSILQYIDNSSQRSSSLLRTRHNSLEIENDADKKLTSVIGLDTTSFATLPRKRGNTSSSSLLSLSSSSASSCYSFKDYRAVDILATKRLSGTIPTLEPLYEHAVSNPVKPRNNDNIIPWWELATRKYRHRSCPSLQAHVVSAFEQSLSNMTQRLQQLTATAEKKDSELQELRDTIERLRKQSAEAGLNNGTSSNGHRHTLGDSDSGTTGCTGYGNHQSSSIARQLSADSVTSLNSLSSACSASSHNKKKGWLRSSFSKAFSRSRKNRQGSVSDAEDCKDIPSGELSAPNSPRLPTASKHDKSNQNQEQKVNGQKSPEHEHLLSASKSSSALYKKDDDDVDELKKQLREKDMVLTDIRLEALSSAHQLESLKDTVIKMRNEMLNLKQNNERLQRLVTSKSLTSSQSSLPSDPERRFSMTEVASSVAALSNGDNGSTADQLEDLNVPEHQIVPTNTRSYCQSPNNEPVIEQDVDGKRINVAVYLGNEKCFNLNLISANNEGIIGEPPQCIIANVCISNKTTWDSLDSTVRRCFKDYISRVDPVTNLGLSVECIAAYHLGEASKLITDSQNPELLPCGYLIGHVKTIYLVLSGYSWLAIDTLIPRSIVQRLVSLLTEHRRVILCGPSGTGKSYLAGKLAHALVDTDAESKDAAAVATFNVDHKSSKELRQYLVHISERCDSNTADELPRVIILENLQHATSLGELFSGLLGTRHSSCPAIIGTMSQATCSTTNLQLHHNFRWVLCANHMEPVKGFLGRYLRRKLLEHDLRESDETRNAEMAAVVEWLPRVWLHLNKFLEIHSSSDVTIGPKLFLPCPMEVAGSQVWFTDLWNYTVIPYLVEAVREGLTLYGRRSSGNGNTDGAWEDPAQFIISSYPWISTHAIHGGSDALLRLRPEDVGYDVINAGHTSGGASSVKSLGSTHSDTEGDPLLNMLMRLQEAANYSSPHSNDSDSVTSLDSSHTRNSEDLNISTSSRGVESAL